MADQPTTTVLPGAPSPKQSSFFIPLIIAAITFPQGLVAPPIPDQRLAAAALELTPPTTHVLTLGRKLEHEGDVQIKRFLVDWLCSRYASVVWGDMISLKDALESNPVLEAFYNFFNFQPTQYGLAVTRQIRHKDRADRLEGHIGGLFEYIKTLQDPIDRENARTIGWNFIASIFNTTVFPNLDALVHAHIFSRYISTNPFVIENVDLRRALIPRIMVQPKVIYITVPADVFAARHGKNKRALETDEEEVTKRRREGSA